MMMRRQERRERRRFPVSATMEYRLIEDGMVTETGSGRVVNMSSGGVLFTSMRGVPHGKEIELTIWWPVKLDGYVPLSLKASGTTVRSRGVFTAVKLSRHEFHVRGKHRLQEVAMAMTA